MRLRWRIDIGVADHELFQNVILNGPGSFSSARPALPRDDIKRQDRQNGTVHGHGNRHFVERDAVKQGFPCRAMRVDRHARHANIAATRGWSES